MDGVGINESSKPEEERRYFLKLCFNFNIFMSAIILIAAVILYITLLRNFSSLNNSFRIINLTISISMMVLSLPLFVFGLIAKIVSQ